MRCVSSFVLVVLAICLYTESVPINIAFHWHLHQPIYYPYESVVDTINNNRFPSGSLEQIFTDRTGPYNSWPVDAVTTANKAGLGHCGAQITITGALQENLNNLANSSLTGAFKHWTDAWKQGLSLKTSLGNPAVYLSAFGYHHPMMPLVGEDFPIITQILLHRFALSNLFGISDFPRGLFPPENAFSTRMIPALVSAGIKWVLVDNIHFDRAHVDYPFTTGSNLYPPNPSDQRNNASTSWVQLNNVWAPGKISAPFGYRPYWVQYVDPDTGAVSQIIAVPGARYEGVEDGRGGYGALQYQEVMSQYAFANTDPTRPMLTLLAHDGDNYGGGTDSYYHGNFDQFVNWLTSGKNSLGENLSEENSLEENLSEENSRVENSGFTCTTVEDYLAQFPVPASEIIHVEDGSWSGANNGDPQFLKWNPNFFAGNYEPERNSFAVITAVMNRVLTAQNISPYKSLANILYGIGTDTERAIHYFLCGEASDYEYWPTVPYWNSLPTIASNLAAEFADKVISTGTDEVPPTIFVPQREFWNPGSANWNPNKPDPSDFGIWTVGYDISGISAISLKIRITPGLKAPTQSNLLYSGGTWMEIPMKKVPLVGPLGPTTDPLPTYISDLYQANVTGVRNSLVDYYVFAQDGKNNLKKTAIQHVWVN